MHVRSVNTRDTQLYKTAILHLHCITVYCVSKYIQTHSIIITKTTDKHTYMDLNWMHLRSHAIPSETVSNISLTQGLRDCFTHTY